MCFHRSKVFMVYHMVYHVPVNNLAMLSRIGPDNILLFKHTSLYSMLHYKHIALDKVYCFVLALDGVVERFSQ